jgi:hypothetical protein
MKAVQLGRPIRREARPKADEHLFVWTVFILLLCGFAVACWIGTFYIFSHPEIGFAYQLLNRLHKLDPPRRFELTGAPSGEFVSPEKLLERYGSMSAGQLSAQSDELLRSYLRNYDHQMSKVPYITGRFTVLDSIPLRDDRFITSGVAVIAQSVDVPAVLIEHFFPASKEHLPAMEHILTTGLGIELRRSYDLSAAVHVTAIGAGRLLISCVPLLYGPYGTTQNGAGFQLEPPKTLNVKAGLPLVRPGEIQNSEKRYTEYRRATGIEPATAFLPSAKNSPALAAGNTRNPTPFELVPIARALPVMKSTPGPLARAIPRPGSRTASTATPAPSAAAASPSSMAERPKTFATTKISPAPAPTVAPGPSPAPVLTNAATSTNDRVSSWTTYLPGKMPRGRLLGVDQTSDLADRGIGLDVLYLRGEFVVTAARENRAVLRPKRSLADRVLNRVNARVIVEVPRGLATPREGENLQRGSDRPFQIVDIRHGADGQLNVYVREVTLP